MAPLRHTKSNDPSRMAINESSIKPVATGSVSSDGRLKVHFHDNVGALSSWVERFQGAFAEHPSCQAPKTRRRSSVIPADGKTAASSSLRLNIAIHIVGSRGDVQPFIPIAQLLSQEPYNHRVRICTHPVFKDFVESQGVEFFSIGGDPEALMAYMVKNPGLLPSRGAVKAGEVGKRRKEMWEIMKGAWRSCIEAGDGMGGRVKAANVRDAKDLFIADAIIANPPSMAHIHCAEKLGIPLHMVFTMPWSPTKAFPHPLAAMSYGDADKSIANYFSFITMELLTWEGLGDLINKLRTQVLALDPISPMWGFQLLPRLRVPYSYLWSEALIPKPADWDSHVNITGFSYLPLASSYTPPTDLVEFLNSGPPPVYIGFGSIVVEDPPALTKMVFDAVRLAGVRAIVSKGWGGVGGENPPDNVYLVGNCPHDWLFQRVSAVVHHGGAGTTAAGIAAGRPTVVVPFFGDQPFWGQMMARTGAGPVPVAFKDMTADILAQSIQFALRPDAQTAALEMARNVADEDGAGDTANDIQDRLDVDQLRCDLCPERLASWRHKKTGAHLSSFAVANLVDQGIIQPHSVKLLRHRHWYVDEGAEHPVVGAVAAFTGFIQAVGTATADYSFRLKGRSEESELPDEKAIEHAMQNATDHTKHESTAGADDNITEKGQHQDNDRKSTEKKANHEGLLKDILHANSVTPAEMEQAALKMAKKSLRSADPEMRAAQRTKTGLERRTATYAAQGNGKRSRARTTAIATGQFAGDLTIAGLKAPVAFFYNIANGFHNYPSYSFGEIQVRRREEITGFGSGVKTAGTEFVLGLWDAFSGVAMKPYKGAKKQGAKGFGKGVWFGTRDFFCNIGAAVFGLSGYTLKGVEKELSKSRLTKLKAELLLIRLRQGMEDFRNATPEERAAVIVNWNNTFVKTA